MVLTSGLGGAGASMGSPLLLNIVGAVVLGGPAFPAAAAACGGPVSAFCSWGSCPTG
jgi:hypothetical protein